MIRIKNLSKKYKKTSNYILDNINLEIPNSSSLIFITGKNGSGKSTLLNIIGLLDLDFKGEYEIDGQKVDSSNSSLLRSNYFDFLSQEVNLINDLKVKDNLNLIYDKKYESYSEFNISELLNKYPDQLSGGEKQKVNIIRSLQIDNPILLLDEPTNNLDLDSRIELMNLLKQISKEKIVIIVSHDSEFVDEYADAIINIENKKITYKSINKNDKLITNIELKKRRLSFRNILKLTFCYFRKRMLNSFLFFLICLVSVFSFLSLISFFNFDSYGETYKLLKQNEEYYISDYNSFTIDDKALSGSIYGNNFTKNEISKTFAEEEYGYFLIGLSNECNIKFEKNDLKINEVIVNQEIYDYLIENNLSNELIIELPVYRQNNKFKVVGTTDKPGYYLNVEYLNECDFLSIRHGLFLFNDSSPLFTSGKSMIYMSESYYNSINSSSIDLNENEVILDSDTYKVFLQNQGIGKTYFFPDMKKIENLEVRNQYVDLNEVYSEGVKVVDVSDYKFDFMNREKRSFMVVDDAKYNQIKSLNCNYDGLYFTYVSDKEKVAKFVIDNDWEIYYYNFEMVEAYSEVFTIHKMINIELTDTRNIFYLVLFFFVLSFNLVLIKQIEIAKKNEIVYFSRFNINKIVRSLPILIIESLFMLLSISVSLIVFYLLNEGVNETLRFILQIENDITILKTNNVVLGIFALFMLLIYLGSSLIIFLKRTKNLIYYEKRN